MTLIKWNKHNNPLRYSILDPTGNVTALVESEIDISRQGEIAALLMKRHPEVEQVGFVSVKEAVLSEDRSFRGIKLRMAGGEFCGNASMSTAALFLASVLQSAKERKEESVFKEKSFKGFLNVEGISRPVEVTLTPDSEDSFYAGLHMPPAVSITESSFSFRQRKENLPVVRLEGISHIIIESGSAFFDLMKEPEAAEAAVMEWNEQLDCDGLGLMFLEEKEEAYRLIPLVYVPGSGTVFWENSCASGSSAVGMYLAEKTGLPVDHTLNEPGGSLRVESFPDSKKTYLYGQVRLAGRYTLE